MISSGVLPLGDALVLGALGPAGSEAGGCEGAGSEGPSGNDGAGRAAGGGLEDEEGAPSIAGAGSTSIASLALAAFCALLLLWAFLMRLWRKPGCDALALPFALGFAFALGFVFG